LELEILVGPFLTWQKFFFANFAIWQASNWFYPVMSAFHLDFSVSPFVAWSAIGFGFFMLSETQRNRSQYWQ